MTQRLSVRVIQGCWCQWQHVGDGGEALSAQGQHTRRPASWRSPPATLPVWAAEWSTEWAWQLATPGVSSRFGERRRLGASARLSATTPQRLHHLRVRGCGALPLFRPQAASLRPAACAAAGAVAVGAGTERGRGGGGSREPWVLSASPVLTGLLAAAAISCWGTEEEEGVELSCRWTPSRHRLQRGLVSCAWRCPAP